MSEQTQNTKFEVKELHGTLNKSKVKTKDSQPDMFGDCLIGGIKYRISGWSKTSQSGNKYLSLSFSDIEKYKKEQMANSSDAPDDNDLPF